MNTSTNLLRRLFVLFIAVIGAIVIGATSTSLRYPTTARCATCWTHRAAHRPRRRRRQRCQPTRRCTLHRRTQQRCRAADTTIITIHKNSLDRAQSNSHSAQQPHLYHPGRSSRASKPRRCRHRTTASRCRRVPPRHACSRHAYLCPSALPIRCASAAATRCKRW